MSELVGSARVQLILDRSSFDRQLAQLQRETLKPLKLDVQASLGALKQQFAQLRQTKLTAIKVPIELDSTQFKREVQANSFKTINIKSKIELDSAQFNTQVQGLKSLQIKPLKLLAEIDTSKVLTSIAQLQQQIAPIKIPVAPTPSAPIPSIPRPAPPPAANKPSPPVAPDPGKGAELGRVLGTSFGNAEKLAKGLQLSNQEALQAVKLLQKLTAVGASTGQRYQALGQTFGLTAQQIRVLDNAVQNYNRISTKVGTAGGFDKDLKGAQALAKGLNTSIPQAQALSRQLGLTATESAKLVTSLKTLQSGGATAQQSFNQLNQGLGTTAKQYQIAERAIARYNQQQAAADAANTKSRQSTLEQVRALDNQAKATEKQQAALQTLAAGSGATAAAIGAIAVKGVKTFADFDSTIRTFGVVTESTGTQELAALRSEVERLGATTSKTPQEIATLAVELGRAGFTAAQTKDALSGVVLASQATGDDLVRIGEITGATINQFGLAAKDSNRIADLITATGNASAAGANDLGEALSYVGTQAKDSNQSLDTTLLALGQLANAGIKGSSAGTGLAEALRRIKIVSAGAATDLDGVARTSIKAQKAFALLKDGVRDSNGQLKPLPQILDTVKAGVSDLSQGDKDILLDSLFGVQGGRAVAALIGGNADQVANLKKALDNAEGSAAKAGVELQKGLGASLQQLGAASTTSLGKIGETLAGSVEPAVRSATALFRVFNELPAPIQKALIAVGTFTGVLAGATFAITAFVVAQNLGLIAAGKEAIAIVGNTIAIGANTIAKLANAKVSLSAATAQGIFSTAVGVSTPLIGGATIALGAMKTALATIAPLLLVASAGIAAIQFVRFTEQLTELNQKLDETGATTDTVLKSGVNVQQDLRAAIDQTTAAQGKLTAEQRKGAQTAVNNAGQQIDLLKQQLAQAEKTPKAKGLGILGIGEDEAAAQNTRRDLQVNTLKAQIASIERQKKALEGALSPTEPKTKTPQPKSDSGKNNAAETADAVSAAKQREAQAIAEVDRLVQAGSITAVEAEQRKLAATEERIDAEIAAEKRKLAILQAQAAGKGDSKQEAKIRATQDRISKLELDASKARSAAREKSEKAALDNLKAANEKADQAIVQSREDREIATRQLVASGQIDEEESAKRIEKINQDTLKKQVDEKKSQLAELKALAASGQIDPQEADKQELQLTKDLSGLRKQQIEAEITAQKRLRDEAVRAIDDRIAAEKRRSDAVIANLDAEQKRLVEFANKRIDAQQKLIESRDNLQKALGSVTEARLQVGVSQGDTALSLAKERDSAEDPRVKAVARQQLQQLGFSADASELKILEEKQRRERALEAQKQTAKALEFKLQQQLLELDLKRQAIAQKQTEFEAKRNLLLAQQQQIQAKGELEKAFTKAPGKERDRAIAEARANLQIANQGVALSKEGVALAREQGAAQAELAQNARAALAAQQQAEAIQINAAAFAKAQADALERVKTAKPGEAVSTQTQIAPQLALPTIQAPIAPIGAAPPTPQTQITPVINQASQIPPLPVVGQGISQDLRQNIPPPNLNVEAIAAKSGLGGADRTSGVENILLQQFERLNANIERLANTPRSLVFNTKDPVEDYAKFQNQQADRILRAG